MKLTKSLLTLVLAFVCVFMLFGCGLSQSDADKINEKAKAGEHYTYDEIIKKYGEPTVDATGELFGIRAGALTYIEGITKEEYDEKGKDAFKDAKTLIVTIVDGKATLAVFAENSNNAE